MLQIKEIGKDDLIPGFGLVVYPRLIRGLFDVVIRLTRDSRRVIKFPFSDS